MSFFRFGGNDGGNGGGDDVETPSRSNPPLPVLISHTSQLGSRVSVRFHHAAHAERRNEASRGSQRGAKPLNAVEETKKRRSGVAVAAPSIDVKEKKTKFRLLSSLPWPIHRRRGTLTRLLKVAVHEEVEFLGRERHLFLRQRGDVKEKKEKRMEKEKEPSSFFLDGRLFTTSSLCHLLALAQATLCVTKKRPVHRSRRRGLALSRVRRDKKKKEKKKESDVDRISFRLHYFFFFDSR